MLRLGPTTATIVALFTGFQCFAGSVGFAGTTDSPQPEAVWPTKAWPVSTPEEQGMQSRDLARLVEAVGGYKQDSLLISRHGKIVLDVYYAPYQPNVAHDVRSVTKSIVSTLTAVELKQGLLDSADHPVMDLFSDKQILNMDENKKAITVQHLLDMT